MQLQGNSNLVQFAKQLLYYHTVKVVQIRSIRLGLFHYFVQLCILTYVIVWAIALKKGYQETAGLIGSTSVKVKGQSYILENPSDESSVQVWDATDVVYPPKEPNALFVTTNFWITKDQSRKICTSPEKDSLPPCTKFKPVTDGIETGNTTSGRCDLWAWCPPEDDPIGGPTNFLKGIDEFTVFVRVSAKWPKFDIIRDNIDTENLTDGYNLWNISQMVKNAGLSLDDTKIRQNGTVIAMLINWDCDFDKPASRCKPTFDWIRLDGKSEFSTGFNFRYAHYFYDQNGQTRDLFKVYGVRFLFLVNGVGGKFSVIPLAINIGAGLALLALATFISDFFTVYILPDRGFYKKVKFEEVEQDSMSVKKGGNKEKMDENSPLLLDEVKF